MARRSTLSRAPHALVLICAAALCAAGLDGAAAQSAAPVPPAPVVAPFSKTCQTGAKALSEEAGLPNVAAALAQRRTLRILAMGTAHGRLGPRAGGSYTGLIETMLERALKGTDVTIVNRGVSGELAAAGAIRMRNEVALDEPDLVLWQVGTNDALAYVAVADFTAAVVEQIDWLKRHHVDLVLVGLQFAPQMARDAHYIAVRDALRNLAVAQNVPVIRFYEAMQMVNGATEISLPAAEEFEQSQEGYNCLAQYVARAITLGVFGKGLRPTPQK